MDHQKTNTKPGPTLWEIPDDVWPMTQALLDERYPATRRGHRRVDLRRVLNGILFRLRTGCQWNQLPTQFGDASPGPRHFQPGCQQGLFARIWAMLIEACDELGGVDWPWQAADPMLGKARMGGDLVGRDPTDRGEKG